MSTTVTYKGNNLTTVNNQTRTLKTAGTYLEDDITLVDVSSGTGAVSVVDTTDTHGGTIRTITALDISDTTAVASDVAQGKYFYTAAGIKTAGTGSGGSGGSKQEKTGTITGNGTNVIQISCDFEPQEIYIHGDLTGDATLRGIVSFALIKDKKIVVTNDSSTSNIQENAMMVHDITGYNEDLSSTEPYASYSNGVLTINTVMNSSGARWTSGISYSYDLITYESVATDHVIHLEFSDSTDTDINVYYNDALLGTMITAYTPRTWTYSSKQVVLAQLDNTTWYEYMTIPLNTELVDYTTVTSDYNLDADGTVKEAQWYGVTDYIPIDSEMVFSYKANMWGYSAFYDSSKAFLSSFNPYYIGESADPNDSNVAVGTLGGTGIAIPSTAAYIRMGTMANPDNTVCSLIRTA